MKTFWSVVDDKLHSSSSGNVVRGLVLMAMLLIRSVPIRIDRHVTRGSAPVGAAESVQRSSANTDGNEPASFG